MAEAITREELLKHDVSGQEAEDAHLRPSEQYMKGGRDTAIVVWSLIALVVAGFMMFAAAVGGPHASSTTSAQQP